MKYKITTVKQVTKKYYLTYIVESDTEESAIEEVYDGGITPIDEELFDEDSNESVETIDNYKGE